MTWVSARCTNRNRDGPVALIWWAPQPVIGLLGLAALGVAFAPIHPLLGRHHP
jgi:hypothetical protein